MLHRLVFGRSTPPGFRGLWVVAWGCWAAACGGGDGGKKEAVVTGPMIDAPMQGQFVDLLQTGPQSVDDSSEMAVEPSEPAGESTPSEGGSPGAGAAPLFKAPAMPNGRVVYCLGDDCPAGECDNEGFAGDPTCEAGYPDPIENIEEWCAGTGTVAVCLSLGDGEEAWDWAVNCSPDGADFTLCNRPEGSWSCGVRTTAECGE